ncbi:MAG: GNAT family N-acetyltransferase [Planctomycetaceae bacterium]
MTRILPPRTPTQASAGSVTVRDIDAATEQHVSRRYWDWLRLYERDGDAAVLRHPERLVNLAAAARAECRRNSALLTCGDDGGPAALAVLVPKDIPARRVGGWGLPWTFRGDWLAGNELFGRPDEPARSELLHAVAGQLTARRSDFLLVEDLDEHSPLRHELAAMRQAGFRIFEPYGLQARHRLQLPDDAAEYWSRFSGRRRNLFRRRLRQIGAVECECVQSPDQVADFLEQAHRISQKTWQSRRLGLRIRNDETELAQLTFLAMHGALRSYLLRQGDRPLAFLIGHQSGGTFHYEEVGFDGDEAKSSPGLVLLLKVLDDLFARDRPAWFDFGAGDAEYKQLFASHSSRSGDVWLVPPGVRRRAAFASLNLCRAARRRGQACCECFNAWPAVRQWLRRR